MDGLALAFTAGEFFRMSVTAVLAACGGVSFGNLIQRVIDDGSQKQMSRIDARHVVAPMAYQHSFGDRSVCQRIRNAMRACIDTVDSKASVSVRAKGARLPFPTFIWPSLVYLGPEAFRDWAFGANDPIVTVDKAYWLPFDAAESLSRSLGNWGGLAASAFTQFWGSVGREVFVDRHTSNYRTI